MNFFMLLIQVMTTKKTSLTFVDFFLEDVVRQEAKLPPGERGPGRGWGRGHPLPRRCHDPG